MKACFISVRKKLWTSFDIVFNDKKVVLHITAAMHQIPWCTLWLLFKLVSESRNDKIPLWINSSLADQECIHV